MMEEKILSKKGYLQMSNIVLASGSPRRQELLKLVTEDFEICPVDADETIPEGMPNAVVGTAESFFNDYANGDYTPKAGGPLVGKGANYEGMASVDLAGNPRKVGSRIDIGCYEASSAAFIIIVR
jgi:hypothetical protein